MSGNTTPHSTAFPARRRTDPLIDVPAPTGPTAEPASQASRPQDASVDRDLLKALLAGLEDLVAGRNAADTALVDLTDEQVVELAEGALVDLLATALPGADASKATNSLTFERVRCGVYSVRVHSAVTVRPFEDWPHLRSTVATQLKGIALNVEFVAQMRLASDGRAHGNLEVAAVHFDAIAALQAREAALQGQTEPVAGLASLVLGLHRSERWNEALSTALLGSWAQPLLSDTGNSRSAMERLEAEARTIHTQLVPLWRRETSGARVLLLDAPAGNGSTLYDLVVSGAVREDTAPFDAADDARLGVLLRALRPEERAVVLARACPGVASWEEAALVAGAADPGAMGRRVRRKVNRIKARHKARAAAALRQGSERRSDRPEPGGRGE
ncbi:hypothetical protein [Streptomyces longispororuber]|uniref:hypothetical protein n=1 Tax=Streptomyces longispororuber TaxID=68230 RepID=UPI00210CE13D|nr:hypothetical protein [Streptomyces longispororuber]MCQ4208342.1 hypothetical protein [Streptomyces longispororuber]